MEAYNNVLKFLYNLNNTNASKTQFRVEFICYHFIKSFSATDFLRLTYTRYNLSYAIVILTYENDRYPYYFCL